MSLHICYRLLLPGNTAVDDIRDKVGALKAFAETIGFDKVVGPAEYSPDDLVEDGDPPDFGRICALTMCGDPPDFYDLGFGEPCAITFAIAPGAECDPAILGFIAPGSRSQAGLPEDDLHPGEWIWSGACGIGNAASISEAHFLKCHLGLIRVLDHAATLGITVEVEDETGYWQHRSSERLVEFVREIAWQEKLAEEEYVRWLETHGDGDIEKDVEHDLALIRSWRPEDQADGDGEPRDYL